MSTTVEVRGDVEIARTMKKAAVALGVMKDAAAQTAGIVAAAARPRAPHRTGRLANSLRPTGAKNGTAWVRSPLIYANPIHWGWSAHGIAAHPFLSDAAVATEPAWSAVYAAAVDDAIALVRGA